MWVASGDHHTGLQGRAEKEQDMSPRGLASSLTSVLPLGPSGLATPGVVGEGAEGQRILWLHLRFFLPLDSHLQCEGYV